MADAVHGHEHPEHPPHLAHHFDTPVQQFDSGKLGMWLFLATEILLFGGLFCAYAIYRGLHPEIFVAGHHHLDKTLGAINTVVLIVSSFTMALGVYCAQRSLQKGLIVCLALTLLGGFGFMGIKYVEYKAKWQHGLMPGKYWGKTGEQHDAEPQAAAAPTAGAPAANADAPSAGEAGTDGGATADRSMIALAPMGPAGLVAPPAGSAHGPPSEEHVNNVHQFFAIYFCMTGLHGLHVVAGMSVIAWLLVGAIKGRFSSAYFTPVDLGGLYWHLVDLIWIFLFPLLYLIG